jgi:hypothetical protein
MLLVAVLPRSALDPFQMFCAQRGIQIVTVDFGGHREAYILGKQDRHRNARAHRWIAERFLKQWAKDEKHSY